MSRLLIILALLVLTTSSSFGQKVRVEADKNVNFSKFKTYSWSKGVGARNPIINQMVIDAVNQEFASRGFKKVEDEGDIRVLFAAATEFDLQAAYGGRGNTGSDLQTGIPTGGDSWNITKGTLAVEMFESSSNNSVWRAHAKETLSDAPSNDMQKDAKRVEKTIKKAVTKMFKQFPRAGS